MQDNPFLPPESELLFIPPELDDNLENVHARLELRNLGTVKQLDKLLKNLEKTLGTDTFEICECNIIVRGLKNGGKERQ